MARLLQGAIHWMRGERRLSGVKRPLHHIPTHCTLLGCAFLTCKWLPEGFTHCASNLDTGTRPRILFSSTHLCIFVTWVSTVNFSGRYHLANVIYSMVRLRKKQTPAICLLDRQFRVENNVLTKSFPESGAKRPCVWACCALPAKVSDIQLPRAVRGSFHSTIGSIWKGASE